MAEKVKLTKSKVDALQFPASGQIIVWDKDLPGFGLRLTPGCKAYVAQARVNGKTRRVKLGTHSPSFTAENARKKAIKELSEMAQGVDPAEEKRLDQATAATLKDVVDGYVKDRRDKLKPSTVANIAMHLNTNFSDWAKKPFVSITRDMVAARHTEITDRSPAQADQAFRVLRALLNHARACYRPDGVAIMQENPVDVLNRNQRGLWNGVKARENRIPDGRTGAGWNFLRTTGTDPFQTTIGRTSADLMSFILLTGVRLREATGLTWDRVNLDEGWFHLPDPKNRNPVTLPLSEAAVKILKDRPRINEFVFPSRDKEGCLRDARAILRKLSKVVGEDVCAHDLRRTFTNVAMKSCKIELWKVKMLTNHKLSGDVTIEHYSDKKDLRFLKPETEKVSQWIVEQAKIAAAQNVVPIEKARKVRHA